ncbi:MAG TPA: DegV family protein [Candidatus Deferrimicrobiaceae bacterium]|nr:DegV family protein [Candidatus Deferrimicrobiaceae bacterium]
MVTAAIVTSTAADLTPELAEALGIFVVPSVVTFGADTYQAGIDLATDAFWDRMRGRDAPFPITAPPSPGAFKDAYEAAFNAGAEAIVSVQMSARMSATFDSARVAAELYPDREIHVVDSGTASMATGLLTILGAEMAALGVSAAEIARVLARRAADVELYAALDTLEYLRRGGRISGAAARIGALLAVKPVITVSDGQVAILDRVPTRRAARQRVLRYLTGAPVERLAILYSPPADGEAFRDELLARMPGEIDASKVVVCPIGLTIGPHIGPGCVGGVILRASSG